MADNLIQLRNSLSPKVEAYENLHKKKENLLAFRQSIQDFDGPICNKPLQLFLEITSRCNLRCEKCGMNYDPARLSARNIPLSLLEQLHELYESAVEVNTFGYGEMFLYRDLARLVEVLKLHNCRVSGITNGTKIKKEDVIWLVTNRYDQLSFSIDGATQETMKRLRGANLNEILAVLALIKDEKQKQGSDLPKIVVNFVAQKDNYRELPDLIRFLADLDISFIGVNTLHHFSGAIDAYGKFYHEYCLSNVSRNEVEVAINQACQLAQDAGIDFVNYIDMDFQWRQRIDSATKHSISILEPHSIANTKEEMLAPYYCMYPWMSLYLAADRTTKVCCFMSAEENLGEFSDANDVKEIWQGSRLTEIRDYIKTGSVHPACRVCVEHGSYKSYEAVLRIIEREIECAAFSSALGLESSKADNEDDGIEPIFEGYHDIANCKIIHGWVWDINHPNRSVQVEIYDGDNLLAIVTANEFRHDLLSAGKGDGTHAFTFKVPPRLRDGKLHLVRIRVANSYFNLGFTPKPIKC